MDLVLSSTKQPSEAVMAQTAHTDHFASFAEFYPYYLSEHADRTWHDTPPGSFDERSSTISPEES